MSSQASGQLVLAADEPAKLAVISHRQLSDWYEKKQVSTDSKVLASGASHCKLIASIFPAALDVKKIKTGYFSVVSGQNWKLFTTAMDRLGVGKIFNVEKLQLPNSVEMKQLKIWMKEFVEMNEKKFAGVPKEERPGACAKAIGARKFGSQVSVNSRNSVAKRTKMNTPVARNDSKKAARKTTGVEKNNIPKPVSRIVAKSVVKKAEIGEFKVEKEILSQKAISDKVEIKENSEEGLMKEEKNEQRKEVTGKDSEVDKINAETSGTLEIAKDIPVKEKSVRLLAGLIADSMSSPVGNKENKTKGGTRLSSILNERESKCNYTPIPDKGMLIRSSTGSYISFVDDVDRDKEASDSNSMSHSASEQLSLSVGSSGSSNFDPLGPPLAASSPVMKGDMSHIEDENSPFNTAFVTPRRRRHHVENVRRVLEFDD